MTPLSDATGWVEQSPPPVRANSLCSRLTHQCSVVQLDDTLVIASSCEGRGAAMVTRNDCWKLLAKLEAFLDETGGPR